LGDEEELMRASASAEAMAGEVKVRVGTTEITVTGEEPPTPLDLLSASLASCEAYILNTILSTLGYEPDSVSVECQAYFKGLSGVTKIKIKVTVTGVSEEDAKRLWELSKMQCPIYATLEKLGILIEEEVEAGD